MLHRKTIVLLLTNFDKNTNGLRIGGRRSMQVSEVAVVWERKDTETPYWYDLLDPIFTESVDSFTEVSSKAEDLNSVDSDNLDSDEESSVALNSISEKQSERANKAMHQEDASFEEGEEESLKPKIQIRQEGD